MAGGLWVLFAVVLLCACSGSQEGGGEAGGVSVQSSDGTAEPARDPREMSITELNEGPGVLELGVSKLLEEIGVLELLEGYLINVPPTAAFISRFEKSKAWHASHYINADAGADSEILDRFESEVFYHAGAGISSLAESRGSQVLHEAFFGALEDCARDSRWPEVELFVMHNGGGGDMAPDLIEPTFGLSYYEFLQLRHECARYAATYPTLDEATRDELLRPQREHYARAVLDGLTANPHIKVPTRYRDEIDELMRSGW